MQSASPESRFATENLPGHLKPTPEQIIYEWDAPDRPFKKRNRQFFVTAGTITALLSLILFFAGQFLVIAVAIAVLFVSYVLYSVPPQTIRNQLTTYGIRNAGTLYYWEELGRFWIEEKFGQSMLVIEVFRWPNRITMVVESGMAPPLTEAISEVLLNERPPLTPIERAAKWLQEKVPLDLE